MGASFSSLRVKRSPIIMTKLAVLAALLVAADAYAFSKFSSSNLFVYITNMVRKPCAHSNFRAVAYAFQFSKYSFKAPLSHTHPDAFEARANAVSSLRNHLTENCLKSYDPSLAKRDSHFDVTGHRHVHSVQDMMGPLSADSRIPMDHVITLIDQDYYYDDLTEFAPRPIAFYTVVPSALSGKGNNSVYYYTSPLSVTEHVEGGARYAQRLFDYSADIVCIEHKTWLGIGAFTLYNVHRVFEPDSNKAMIFLSPSYTYYLPLSLYKAAGFALMGHHIVVPMLTKVSNVVDTLNGFLVGKFGTVQCPTISIKRASDVGPESSVNIPEGVYCGLLYLSQLSGQTWSLAQVKRYLIEWKCVHLDGVQLVTLTEYFKFPAADLFRVNFIILPTKYDGVIDEGRKNAALVCPPIVAPAVVVSETPEAFESYVDERVQPNQNLIRFDDITKQYAGEFVKNLVRNPGKLVPDDQETVEQAQSNAAQRVRNRAERLHLPKSKDVVNTCIKREPVLKTGPARGVNTVPTSHTHATARYAKPFNAVIKQLGPSYNVGMNNVDVGDCVMQLASAAEAGILHEGRCYIAESDFSKLDETISQDIREFVVEAVLMRAYHDDYKTELRTVLNNDKNQNCIAGHVKFQGLYKNLSGSGFTTLINTLTNLFWKYVLHRGMGYTILESFKMFGLNYGDDGLHVGPRINDSGILQGNRRDYTPEKYIALCEETGTKMGLKVKLTLSQPCDNVYFLGREYPNPLVSATSLSRPSRCLRRMPVSVSGLAKDLPNRLRGYYVTESHVPLVGDYFRAVGRVYGIALDVKCTVTYEEDRDLFHKLKRGVIPYSPGDDSSLMDSVCRDLALAQHEVSDIITKLQNANTRQELSDIFIDLDIPEDDAMFMRV